MLNSICTLKLKRGGQSHEFVFVGDCNWINRIDYVACGNWPWETIQDN
ncbi:MAG: hypothetical protein ACPLXL_00200 [Minisyncoccia bacterium]